MPWPRRPRCPRAAVLLAVAFALGVAAACSGGGDPGGNGNANGNDSNGNENGNENGNDNNDHVGSGGGTGFRWLGRVLENGDGTGRFGWQGSGVAASVAGAEVAVRLRNDGWSEVWFQPVIDGAARPRFGVAAMAEQTVQLATGLGAGDHTVELFRETESWLGITTFLGFTAGTVTGAPSASGRRVEVVGDSISAGYGNLGYELHPNWVANPHCDWSPENSSWYATYAAVAGRALHAEVVTVAHSGWGLYQDLGGSPGGTLGPVYLSALSTEDATPWTFPQAASAVVVNLGTNDEGGGNFSQASYVSAGLSLVDRIRAHAPDAWIVFAIGPMLGDPERLEVVRAQQTIVSAAAAAGDHRLAQLDLGTQDLGADGLVPTGCDWHPSVAENQRMAGLLQAELATLLGW